MEAAGMAAREGVFGAQRQQRQEREIWLRQGLVKDQSKIHMQARTATLLSTLLQTGFTDVYVTRLMHTAVQCTPIALRNSGLAGQQCEPCHLHISQS